MQRSAPSSRVGLDGKSTSIGLTCTSELHVLREMLMQKYGREFALTAVENREGCVPERVSIGQMIGLLTKFLTEGLC